MYAGKHAQTRANQPAFIMASTGETVSYAELEARTNRLAHLLRAHGLKRLDHYAIFMENNNRYLEACGAGERAGLYYTCVNSYLKADELAYILQNSESFAFVDSLVDDGHLTYQGAGTTDDGQSIFIQGRLPEGGEVAPGDFVWPYLAFVNYHDGSGSVTACLTSVRIVCGNTQRAAVREGRERGNAINIRHTKNMHERLDLAREVFGWAQTNFGEFLRAAKSLSAKNVVSHKALSDYFKLVVEAEPAKDGMLSGKTVNKIDRLVELFEVGAGNDRPGVRGTWWAAVNAVTQFVDHEAPTAVRSVGRDLSEAERAAAIRRKRYDSSQTGAGADTKDRAMALALGV